MLTENMSPKWGVTQDSQLNSTSGISLSDCFTPVTENKSVGEVEDGWRCLICYWMSQRCLKLKRTQTKVFILSPTQLLSFTSNGPQNLQLPFTPLIGDEVLSGLPLTWCLNLLFCAHPQYLVCSGPHLLSCSGPSSFKQTPG